MNPPPTEPGWYPHPSVPGQFGYFDGRMWAGDVRKSIPADGLPPSRADKVPYKPAPTPGTAVDPLAPKGFDTSTPGVLLGLGAVLIAVGVIILGTQAGETATDLAEDAGSDVPTILAWLTVSAGALFAQIGVVAFGVSIGVRHAKATTS